MELQSFCIVRRSNNDNYEWNYCLIFKLVVHFILVKMDSLSVTQIY